MSIVIVQPIPASMVEAYIAQADFYSPLRSVASHVARAAIERSYAFRKAHTSTEAIILGAEMELVQQYVREDFCGLCGRFTDHRGEH